jgi:hypothetical protein
LRAIESFSGLNAAELLAIRRQNPQLAKSKEQRAKSKEERTAIEQYRLAVDDARSGRLKESFDRLNRNGGITQCGRFEQSQFLTKRYLELATQKCSTVVVSQSLATASLNEGNGGGSLIGSFAKMHPSQSQQGQDGASRQFPANDLTGDRTLAALIRKSRSPYQ